MLCYLLFVLGRSVYASADRDRAFTVESYKKDDAGVTLTTTQGLMRIEVCTDRIIHVLMTSESSFPRHIERIQSFPCKVQTRLGSMGKRRECGESNYESASD